ncbi:uncharacterized protein LOC142237582 [Haematobia irritans]|uniref:uncharacterized protein LOC142237582 n=1 Tax=Haematobia irritans TaxID=7368 RepID=UPI003F4F6FEB
MKILEMKGYPVLFGFACIAILFQSVGSADKATPKPGRYVPELHGGLRGKYVPDLSGKYIHIHRPYDGGYGDRGLKYVHDSKGNIFVVKSDGSPGLLPLGRNDHLRFMVDFNYDGSGWQIIKFEWFRDGDDSYQYNYSNENRIWDVKDGIDKSEVEPLSTEEENTSNSDGGEVLGEAKDDAVIDGNADGGNVHVDAEYVKNSGYDYTYTERTTNSNGNNKNLQSAIKDVLEFIEVNILPTL